MRREGSNEPALFACLFDGSRVRTYHTGFWGVDYQSTGGDKDDSAFGARGGVGTDRAAWSAYRFDSCGACATELRTASVCAGAWDGGCTRSLTWCWYRRSDAGCEYDHRGILAATDCGPVSWTLSTGGFEYQHSQFQWNCGANAGLESRLWIGGMGYS